MSDSAEERPEPVGGTVFPSSLTLRLALLLIGLLFMVCLIVWLPGMFDRGNPPSLKTVIGMSAAGPARAFLFGCGVRMFVRKRRFVVGHDRFQFVERVGGEDVVMTQVMFANVTGLALNRVGNNVKVVSVYLADPKAAGTYDVSRYFRIVRPRPDGCGYEARIPDEFRGKIERLLETLDDAVMAWRAERSDD